MPKDLSNLPQSEDRCVCKHAWTSHHKVIPPDYAQRFNLRILSKPRNAYCVLCKKWCSTKNAPKDLI
jgi:hypothetical protein